MKCGYCGKSKVIEIDHEVICKTCGIVLQNIENNLGNDEFTNDINDRRTGAPTSLTMHDRGLSTVINSANKDVTGKPLSNANRAMVQRLRTWDSRSQINEAQARVLREAMHVLNNIINKLSLPDTLGEKAAYIYRKANDKKLVRGRSVTMMVVACVYASCRELGIHRTLKEMAIVSNVKRKDIARCFRLLTKELDLKPQVMTPEICVTKVATLCGVNGKVTNRALKIIRMAQEIEETAGKDPIGLAAAAVYLAAVQYNVDITQRNIAIRAEITEVTIRNRAKGLREMLSNEKSEQKD